MNSVNSEIRQEKRSIGLDSVKVKGHTHWCVYCLAPRIEPRGELTCASFGFPNHTTMRGSTPSLLTFTRSYMTAKSRRFLALAVVFVLSWGFFVLAAGEAHAEQLPEAQQPKTQVKQPKTLVNNGKSPKNEGDNMTVVGRKPPAVWPPVEQPPVEQPPAEQPPAGQPPTGQPPDEHPPLPVGSTPTPVPQPDSEPQAPPTPGPFYRRYVIPLRCLAQRRRRRRRLGGSRRPTRVPHRRAPSWD